MTIPTLEALADEYLRTPDGRTASEPCGAWCGDGDVTAWVYVVRRIRADMQRTVQRAPGTKWTPQIRNDAAAWVWKSSTFKTGGILDVFGGGTPEVLELVAHARRGVDLLHDLQVEIDGQGGVVASPGPKGPAAFDLFPGPDGLWWAAGGAILAVLMIRAMR